MSTIRTARAESISVVVATLPCLARWIPRVLVAALCLGTALGVTAVRLQITSLGYELERLSQERERIASQVGELELEVATLATPKRIEREALRLGMVRPSPGSIVLLDE